MNTQQVEQLVGEIFSLWPKPAPEVGEADQWAKHLAAEDQSVAARTLTYLEKELVQGNPRRFRPALTEWVHRYKLIDKARQAPLSLVRHECVDGMIRVTGGGSDGDSDSYRPCEVCNSEAHERWLNGEYQLKVDPPAEIQYDPEVGFDWLKQMLSEREPTPGQRPAREAA